MILKAYAYMLTQGSDGLRAVADYAVLNANYVQEKLKDLYELPYYRHCMHECVFSAQKQIEKGVHALDLAKALLDRGMHAPTIYFPLIVKEALMIEPTETESREMIDEFIAVMRELAVQAEKNPASFGSLPESTPVTRLDDTKAARDMKLRV